MSIKLILGLGNPGPAYAATRHNAGAWFLEALSTAEGLNFKIDSKLQARTAELRTEKGCCRLAIPTVYMNHSGQSLRALCQFYRLQPEEVLIAHDELDLPAGKIKLKTAGGHGGHNGLRDSIQQLASAEFHRLRIGIGHPGHRDQVSDYVLARPAAADKLLIIEAIERAISVTPLVLEAKLDLAMNILNI